MDTPSDERLLVLMPTARDGERTGRVLAEAGIDYVLCGEINHLCGEVGRGAGAALLTEEAIEGDRAGRFRAALKEQPPWSDFPLVMLAREGEADAPIRETMNATLVERPMKARSLLSVVRAALRSRRLQYEVRDHLDERRRAADSQDYLVKLADTLRPLSDPVDVQAEASRVLGERLGANRVVYFEIAGTSTSSSGITPRASGRSPVDIRSRLRPGLARRLPRRPHGRRGGRHDRAGAAARRAGGVRGHPGAGPCGRAAGQGGRVRGRDDRPRLRPAGLDRGRGGVDRGNRRADLGGGRAGAGRGRAAGERERMGRPPQQPGPSGSGTWTFRTTGLQWRRGGGAPTSTCRAGAVARSGPLRPHPPGRPGAGPATPSSGASRTGRPYEADYRATDGRRAAAGERPAGRSSGRYAGDGARSPGWSIEVTLDRKRAGRRTG